MKRLLLLPVLFFLALSFPSDVNAQGTLKCEESGTSTITIPMWLCYLRSDYDDVNDMIEQGQTDLESTSLTCDASGCKPNPDVFHCDASVTGRDARGIETKDEDGYFCFKGSYEVTWKCSMCRRNPKEGPKEIPEKLPLKANGNYQAFAFTQLEATDGNGNNKLIKIYPNPSNGIFNTQINIENSDSVIHLIVTDVSGKTVLQKDYSNAPVGVLNTTQDLSELSNGLYLISVKVEGQIIGTSKVTVQHNF